MVKQSHPERQIGRGRLLELAEQMEKRWRKKEIYSEEAEEETIRPKERKSEKKQRKYTNESEKEGGREGKEE